MDSAFTDYAMMISIEHKSAKAWLGIGRVELKRGKMLNAQTAFNYAIQYGEGLYRSLKHTKDDLFKGKDDDAGTFLVATRNLLDAYSCMGVLEQLRGNLDASKEYFSRGIATIFGEEDLNKVKQCHLSLK